MLAHYGYEDASGDFFITIDTDICDGCGNCSSACPAGIFDIIKEDPNDPFRQGPVAVVTALKGAKLKYECNPCKPSVKSRPLPCVEACGKLAVSHSW